MAGTAQAEAVDQLQKALTPGLREVGFRRKGRTYNRTTSDGLVQVINIQMGAYDPPGTVHAVPGLRENFYGKFTVNLGVYVPEVARYVDWRAETKKYIQEYDCCIRNRLGMVSPEGRDLWWRAPRRSPKPGHSWSLQNRPMS